MIKSEVMSAFEAKKAAVEARMAQLKAEQDAALAELAAMDNGTETAAAALAQLEELIAQTPADIKETLFKSLFKALEQEAKRSGIKLQAEVLADNNGNGSGAKRTRKTTDDIVEPKEFQIFKANNRLAVDGIIDGDSVRYNRVYVGVDGLRTSSACEASASAWKDWFRQNVTSQVKVGSFPYIATASGLVGNYIIELSEVAIKELSKLVDLDFSKSPTGEENEQRMNRDYTQLTLLESAPVEDITPTQEPTEQPEVEPDQVEEIRETEPVEVQEPTNLVQSLYPVGTKFQVAGITGFEGNYGEVVKVNPGTLQPYECQVDGFSYNPLLKHEQLNVAHDADEVENTELADIPF